jgi:hypothetical protein
MDKFPITNVVAIRDCGHDEHWLQDLIYNDPSVLGLGDLEPLWKEKTQSSGGRLDLSLKDPEDDSMYEVELQLGETDESHIIRTIEYWDNEKRRWPNRSHTAVLVAEKINTRFFNVVQLLSKAVPIIGIQANIIEVGDSKAIHFTKIIDSYEEPEEEETQPGYDEKYWVENYPAALECARWYKKLLSKWYGEIPTKYHENYVSLYVGGTALAWIGRRKNDRVSLQIGFYEGNLKEVTDHLTKECFQFKPQKDWGIRISANLQEMESNQSIHDWLVQRIAPDLSKANKRPLL